MRDFCPIFRVFSALILCDYGMGAYLMRNICSRKFREFYLERDEEELHAVLPLSDLRINSIAAIVIKFLMIKSKRV